MMKDNSISLSAFEHIFFFSFSKDFIQFMAKTPFNERAMIFINATTPPSPNPSFMFY